MFLQTLAVTAMIVRNRVRKLQGGSYISLEKRGCYKHVPQVLSILYNDITPTAYLHSESAAKFENQNLHKQARRRYLGNGVNDSELCRLHCECRRKQWFHFSPDEHRIQRNLNKNTASVFKSTKHQCDLICGNKMPTRCNRGFYCRSYCLLNMFRASPCPSSGAQENYTVVAACGILCCGFSSSWSGVELRVMRPVCRMLVY